MGRILSVVLSPAAGVMISPFSVAGLFVILRGDKARSNSLFYMLGWIEGTAAVFMLGMLCMGLRAGQGGQGVVSTFLSLVLGVLLLFLGVREFMKCPGRGQAPEPPKWLGKMTSVGVWSAAGFGFFLSACDAKNLLLSLEAGTQVGALGLGPLQQGASAVVFTLLASASIIIPTLAFLFMGHRMDSMVDSAREWLVQNNAAITSVLLFILGLTVMSRAF